VADDASRRRVPTDVGVCTASSQCLEGFELRERSKYAI
jgi:hypothetical protein